MPEKIFLTPDQLFNDSFILGKQIYDSGFQPDIIIVLWRGGTPVGMAVHEFLLYKDVKSYHTVIKTESYTGIGTHSKVRIEHADALLSVVKNDSKVLVVDDIFDSGHTMHKVNKLLQTKTPNIKLATLYYKPHANQTDLVPDFFVTETNQWIVFPHELMHLTPEEIEQKDPRISALLKD
ncbi:MAG: hypoxanthine phosphoribosyltransferase [Kiritimatiellae bacterium]|nr:hypoxanthine phosphoribosyltransferase [Kiritimatiellia bacterium]